ncbi:acyltransferase family protein [Variovorax boronicumulans]|nr:acyltransferase [Variovorax boronicumulans]
MISHPDIKRHAGEHYQWLDFLRFTAALMVVFSHVRGFLFLDYGALDPSSRNFVTAAFFAFTRLGHEAVIVFFVLSGYLVGGKAVERIAKGNFQPSDYAIDRIARLWVPLVPALLLSAALGARSEGVLTWIGNLLGLQGVLVPMFGGNGPLWSLAYEIWFYVLAYAIGRQAIRKTLDVPALLIFVAVALVFTTLEVHYLACWLIGAAFFVRPHRLSPMIGLATAAVLAGVAVVGLQMTAAGVMAATGASNGLRAAFEILLAIGTSVGCNSLVALKPTRIATMSVPLAAFSYTLYLTHYPLLLALKESGWQRIASLDARAFGMYGAAVALCLVIAWAIYWPFERNTGHIRNFIKRSFRRSQAATAS